MSPKRNEARPQSANRTAANRAGPDLYAPTPAEQRTARIMGGWFLGTFIAIPAFFFYDPILNHADYVAGSGSDTRVAAGALLEILLAIAGIATAVVIFPIAKRVNESVALGYIASRTVESVLILVGVVSLMSIVGLRQDLADTADNNVAAIGVAGGLLAVHDQTAILGPQFCAGLGNGILLGYLMWRSRLLPRPLVMVGLIGGPLALVAGIGVLFGVWESTSGLPVALTAPEAIWEFSLSIWLLVRGFRPSPILTGPPANPEP
jgi:Domain of unknown function (DUF4386)